MPEEEFYGLLKLADDFGLVWLEPDFAAEAARRLRCHPTLGEVLDPDRLLRDDEAAFRRAAQGKEVLPLFLASGRCVGCIRGDHERDPSLTAAVLLENLAAKASGFLALHYAVRALQGDPIDYLLGCGEEAVGDRYQRGGGSLSKAMAEMAGCTQASGSDLKAFCCAPVHALVAAAALVASGTFRRVAVVGGGSLAKLGMKFQGHLARGMPVLEDVLAATAIVVEADDGVSPVLRLDLVGTHPVGAGSSPPVMMAELVRKPLARAGLRLVDVDRYATEMHNPEITEPQGSGNVPLNNYRLIASLAVGAGEIPRDGIDAFVRQRGFPGFSPTQGHIAAAIPLLGWFREEMLQGRIRRALLVAKGSLFLGRMTQQSDGMSVLIESRGEVRA
jgi:betaine reductase